VCRDAAESREKLERGHAILREMLFLGRTAALDPFCWRDFDSFVLIMHSRVFCNKRTAEIIARIIDNYIFGYISVINHFPFLI